MNTPLIEKLFTLNRQRGIHLNLEIPRKLDQLLGYPSRKFRSIHVAGTNGKGSVTTMVAAALQAEGYKTGLFTSPHIHTYKERILVNGEQLPDSWIEEHLSQLMHTCEQQQIPATFFEITTALAFKAFADFQVDFACVEVGVGGRLDATTIIQPDLSIITSIGLDHCDFLGPTLEAIAREKAGIIKPYTPILIGPTVPVDIIVPIAQLHQSPLSQIHGTFPSYLEENRAIARQAMQLLQLSEAAITQGLARIPSCRFEIRHRKELQAFTQHALPEVIVFDVAHNPPGIAELVRAVKHRFPHQRWDLLCGFSKDKDIDGCLAALKPVVDRVFPIASSSPRSCSVEQLTSRFAQAGFIKGNIHIQSSLQESIAKALTVTAESGNHLLVCGTFLIISPIFQFLGLPCLPDALSIQEMQINNTL